jgi:hypothetical protein
VDAAERVRALCPATVRCVRLPIVSMRIASAKRKRKKRRASGGGLRGGQHTALGSSSSSSSSSSSPLWREVGRQTSAVSPKRESGSGSVRSLAGRGRDGHELWSGIEIVGRGGGWKRYSVWWDCVDFTYE